MPSATYTEKDAIFINTEGRLQYANKANFPPGEAKEDWKIINQINTRDIGKKKVNYRLSLKEFLIIPTLEFTILTLLW